MGFYTNQSHLIINQKSPLNGSSSWPDLDLPTADSPQYYIQTTSISGVLNQLQSLKFHTQIDSRTHAQEVSMHRSQKKTIFNSTK
jgi:hypothetical protein